MDKKIVNFYRLCSELKLNETINLENKTSHSWYVSMSLSVLQIFMNNKPNTPLYIVYNPNRRIQHLVLYDDHNNDVVDELLMEECGMGVKTLDYLANGLVIAHQHYNEERWLLTQSKQLQNEKDFPFIPPECQTEDETAEKNESDEITNDANDGLDK